MISATDRVGDWLDDKSETDQQINSEKGVCVGNDSYSWSYMRSAALNATWDCVLPQTAGRERDRKNPQLAETSSLEGRSLAIK